MTGLDLHDNRIGVTGALTLAEMIPQSRLVMIDLDENDASVLAPLHGGSGEEGDESKQAKANAKASSSALGLIRQAIVANQGRKIVDDLLVILKKGADHLSLTHSNSGLVGDRGTARIADALPAARSLLVLSLKEAQIGDAGAGALARALPHCMSLINLSLPGNRIGPAGASALADVLPRAKLEQLALNGNQIGDAGAVRLAEMLTQSVAVARDLIGRKIGPRGVAVLAEFLPQCDTLKKIWLDGNGIGNAGACALADMLPESTLIDLYLGDNQISNKGARRLAAMLPLSALKTLRLRGNRRVGKAAEGRLRVRLRNRRGSKIFYEGCGEGDGGSEFEDETAANRKNKNKNKNKNKKGRTSGGIEGGELVTGARVRIHGLQAATSLNGRLGKVVRALPNGRLRVQLDDGEKKNIKPSNLARLGAGETMGGLSEAANQHWSPDDDDMPQLVSAGSSSSDESSSDDS